MPLPASVMVRLESIRARHSSAWPRSRSRSIAGRETMSAASRQLGTRLGGGLAATGNYPGKARTPDELRSDADKALALIPGRHRFNLHACYGEFGGKRRRSRRDRTRALQGLDRLGARSPASASTSTRRSSRIRRRPTASRCRTATRRSATSGSSTASPPGASARRFGRALATPCVTNVWIPDGMKDTPVDRAGPRERLPESLDAIFAKRSTRPSILDAVEGKLFGIGCESYTVGSHEFYLGYAVTRRKTAVCLDAGHFHPTESIADKICSVLAVLAGDPAARQPRRALGQRPRGHAHRRAGGASPGARPRRLPRADPHRPRLLRRQHQPRRRLGRSARATCSRPCCWRCSSRLDTLRALEAAGDFTARLALLEELKSLPFGAVWDYYCESAGVPVGTAWLDEIKVYERDVLSART